MGFQANKSMLSRVQMSTWREGRLAVTRGLSQAVLPQGSTLNSASLNQLVLLMFQIKKLNAPTTVNIFSGSAPL